MQTDNSDGIKLTKGVKVTPLHREDFFMIGHHEVLFTGKNMHVWKEKIKNVTGGDLIQKGTVYYITNHCGVPRDVPVRLEIMYSVFI